MTETLELPTLPVMQTPGGTGLGLAELLEALGSPDPVVRASAVARVRPQPGVEAVLIETLGDPDPEVRAATVRVLARIESSRSTDALIEISAGDVSVRVRAEAVAALGRILETRTPPDPAGP